MKVKAVMVKAANKHELKTRETQAQLLAAAETIFVRDGYEGAELGEIAALAGRTKGAIYAHFKSKEDIFLALIEERARSFRAEMAELLAKSTSVEGNMEALRGFYQRRAKDQRWSLLSLEFNLFAMRHPESKQRLQQFTREMLASAGAEDRLSSILGPAAAGEDGISRTIAVLVMHPIISSLVLQSQLQADIAGKGVVGKITNRIFDALFDLPKN